MKKIALILLLISCTEINPIHELAIYRPDLKYSNELQAICETHSKLMADMDSLFHGDLRTKLSDIDFRFAAENVCKANSLEHAIEMWMKSECHRDNIMNPNYKQFAVSGNNYYFTMILTD